MGGCRGRRWALRGSCSWERGARPLRQRRLPSNPEFRRGAGPPSTSGGRVSLQGWSAEELPAFGPARPALPGRRCGALGAVSPRWWAWRPPRRPFGARQRSPSSLCGAPLRGWCRRHSPRPTCSRSLGVRGSSFGGCRRAASPGCPPAVGSQLCQRASAGQGLPGLPAAPPVPAQGRCRRARSEPAFLPRLLCLTLRV